MVKKINYLNKLIALIPIFVVFIYNMIFLNRFYPITEGWFSTYAWLFNNGQFPYKDFYLFLTPFYLSLISIFTTIFGYEIFYLRIFGLLIILLITFFLYKNLEVIFKPAIASFVTIVGVIYYQSNNAHIAYDFIQFVTLFSLIQSYLLLKYVNLLGKKEICQKLLFWAGFFAGLAFLTKQSNGLMITLFSFGGLFLLVLLKDRRNILKVSFSYIAGFCVVLIFTALWLLINSAFSQFYQQTFSGAVVAKGGFEQIFLSWFKGILTYNFIFRIEQIFQILLVLGYWIIFFIPKKKINADIGKVFILMGSLVMLPVVILPLVFNINTVNMLSNFGRQGINIIIAAAVFIPVLYVSVSLILVVIKKHFNQKIFLLSFIAIGFIYGTGTSAGITEVGAFLGFCLCVALMLSLKSILGIGKVFIVLFCMSFCIMLVQGKYSRPYYWWGMTSPDVKMQLVSTDKIPILKGIYTSKENIKLVEEVSVEIQKFSKPNEPILTFPNIPAFYLFADRRPPGKALVYWFDFLPDQLAIEEAKVIRKNPPKVIVYLDLGNSVWEAHERMFRNGKPSGQRKIHVAILEIIKSKNMHISKQYKLANDAMLNVWIE